MSTRGSLKFCIEVALRLFKQQRYDLLAITCCTHGKYYTVLTPSELSAKTKLSKTGDDRLVLYCSFGELKSILQNVQTNLDLNLTRRASDTPEAGSPL